MTTNFNAEDLEIYFQKLAAVLFHNEREMEVVYYRAEGKPLTEIGNIIDASREGIRQMELRAIKPFAEHQSEVENKGAFRWDTNHKSLLYARRDKTLPIALQVAQGLSNQG